jgi:anhydro-N-acetylmuramic acid kinase
LKVLGFMTGTSLDAVDMAVLETDGEAIVGFGPSAERKLDPAARSVIEAATRAALAWPWHAPRPEIFHEAEHVIAEQHLMAAREFMAQEGIAPGDLDLAGVHGQTVLHEPPNAARLRGRTIQLIDARRLAEGLGLPVAFDFRTADVAGGGQGAPLAPVYHAALVRWSELALPAAVLNLGGVGNVTLVRSDGELEAYDTGPANGMIDLFVQARTGERCDLDGALGGAGRVNEDVLAAYLAHDYFAVRGPKSLDRYDFSLDPVADLSLEDGAATLTAFAAEAVALGLSGLSETPQELILTGGGRLNPVLRNTIADLVECPVRTAEDLAWRGDSIEAEAFAYLAARTIRGLPISFPGTTGVPRPMGGGRIVRPG